MNGISHDVAKVFSIGLTLALAAGCSSLRPGAPPVTTSTSAAVRPPLGDHHFAITAKSKAARDAFDRGLTLAYAFSHEAAEEEFRRAVEADPKCAMAYWGIALVNGPHINFPLVPPEKAKKAWEALTKARALSQATNVVERDLIYALSRRYADPQPEDRRPLDEAYANSMREMWRKHSHNADVATLFAEAMMDLRPWDLWKADGQPQPGTDEIVTTLERALKLNPRHPGANHLYIHTVEASPNPARAIPAADQLMDLVPGASHLVHMSSHIYARVGRWDDASLSNLKARKADEAYRAAHPKPGFYAMYMAHNHHFYAFVAMMQGRSKDAIETAREMVAGVPDSFLEEYGPVADGYMIFVSEALMRFGKWEEVLAEPEPPKERPLSRALWRYTRAVAFTALGRSEEAMAERRLFLDAVKQVPEGWVFGNNSAADLLTIATHTLDGEMAAKRGNMDDAIAELRKAILIEDLLRYDEPPDWIQPVRHTLGAVLIRAKRYSEAEKVYREDLVRFPENGWSLFGLEQALRMQGKAVEADAVKQRFATAWAGADVTLESTCYCQN